MVDQRPLEKKASGGTWFVLFLLYGVPLLIVLGAAFVGVVKFMAWWRIAFGACSNA